MPIPAPRRRESRFERRRPATTLGHNDEDDVGIVGDHEDGDYSYDGGDNVDDGDDDVDDGGGDVDDGDGDDRDDDGDDGDEDGNHEDGDDEDGEDELHMWVMMKMVKRTVIILWRRLLIFFAQIP